MGNTITGASEGGFQLGQAANGNTCKFQELSTGDDGLTKTVALSVSNDDFTRIIQVEDTLKPVIKLAYDDKIIKSGEADKFGHRQQAQGKAIQQGEIGQSDAQQNKEHDDQAATEQQDVDLSTAMDQMTPEQMETMLDAADEEIPASEDLGEMPEEDEEAEESADEEEPEEDEELEEDEDEEPSEDEALEEEPSEDEAVEEGDADQDADDAMVNQVAEEEEANPEQEE